MPRSFRTTCANFWAVFIKDQGRAARFHANYENHGVLTDNGTLRHHFDLRHTERQLAFPGYYNLVLEYPTLQTVTTQACYEQ